MFTPVKLTYSPVKGPEGNIEYLLYLVKGVENNTGIDIDVEETVFKSHEELDKQS